MHQDDGLRDGLVSRCGARSRRRRRVSWRRGLAFEGRCWASREWVSPILEMPVTLPQKDECRVWWTSEDVVGIIPHPMPEKANLDYLRIQAPIPFVEWCAERYTSASGGRALLTEMPFPSLSGFLTTDFLRTKTSIANMIATVKMTNFQQGGS